MKKLLVIVGPTATGKTNLALYLAANFDGEIISADSRQIYKGMDIGTGKDKPATDEIKIWGYDLVEPEEEFSTADYMEFARAKIKEIWRRGKLPILAGGTGLYIETVLFGLKTVGIEKNLELRNALVNKTTPELAEILESVSPEKLRTMNKSDRANPRRLMRAIEIAQSNKKIKVAGPLTADILFIGLKMPLPKLKAKIEARVEKRINQGFAQERQKLLKKDLPAQSQAMTALGYRQWPDVEAWKKEEIKYAKRQLAWFRRNKQVKWFDSSQKDWRKKVEKIVQKWHNLT